MKSFLRFLCLTLLGVFLQYGNIASADSNRSVGSPKGQFEVSSTGGAVYSVAIDAPKGIGKLQPNVSLTYKESGRLWHRWLWHEYFWYICHHSWLQGYLPRWLC